MFCQVLQKCGKSIMDNLKNFDGMEDDLNNTSSSTNQETKLNFLSDLQTSSNIGKMYLSKESHKNVNAGEKNALEVIQNKNITKDMQNNESMLESKENERLLEDIQNKKITEDTRVKSMLESKQDESILEDLEEKNMQGSKPDKNILEDKQDENVQNKKKIGDKQKDDKDQYVFYHGKRLHLDKLPYLIIPKGAPKSLDSYCSEDVQIKVKTIKQTRSDSETKELKAAQGILDQMVQVLDKNVKYKNDNKPSKQTLCSVYNSLDRCTMVLQNEDKGTAANKLKPVDVSHLSLETIHNVHNMYHAEEHPMKGVIQKGDDIAEIKKN